jgi:hypothetical protein
MKLHAQLLHMLHRVELIGIGKTLKGRRPGCGLMTSNATTHRVLRVHVFHQKGDQSTKLPLIVIQVVTSFTIEKLPEHRVFRDEKRLQREIPPTELPNWIGQVKVGH